MADEQQIYEVAPLLGSLGVCLASVSSALAAGFGGGAAACGVFAISRKAADITGFKKGWTTVAPVAVVIAVSVFIALSGMCVAILVSFHL